MVATSVLVGSMVLAEWLSRGSTYVAGREGRSGALVGNTLLYSSLMAVLLLAVGTWAYFAAPSLPPY